MLEHINTTNHIASFDNFSINTRNNTPSDPSDLLIQKNFLIRKDRLTLNSQQSFIPVVLLYPTYSMLLSLLPHALFPYFLAFHF